MRASTLKERIRRCSHTRIIAMDPIDGNVAWETNILYFAICLECHVMLMDEETGCSCYDGEKDPNYWEPVTADDLYFRIEKYCNADEHPKARFSAATGITDQQGFTLLVENGSALYNYL